MLDLPNVTLLCADCVHIDTGIKALERSQRGCRFGAVRLLTSVPTDYPHAQVIEPLKSIVAYSLFMLKRAHLYVPTSHVLVVQHDGWILNPEVWQSAWHSLDYIGPLFIHKHTIDSRSVGTGGFSFRSKKLMDFVNARVPAWDGSEASTKKVQTQLGSFEDGVISMNLRRELEAAGFKFASPMEASKFAQGGQSDPKYYVPRPFGFHGNWDNIGFETGLVSPPPFTAGGVAR